MQALQRGDPRTVGRYRLLARLGVGGMAVVYFGRSPGRRAAAVKVMHGDLAADPAHRERFRREVTATGAVAGRYCPAVLDADPDAGTPWLATEFLPAVSLRDAVRDHGPLPLDAVWPLAAGIAEALASVHRAGVVHLDVTPANVLLTADGPRLVDFGIAAPIGVPVAPAGSWGFMSPEQAAGGATGAASDVYSLGVTLTFACTGSRDTAGLEQVADSRLRETIARCLRPDPDRRPTVAELLGSLASRPDRTGTRWVPAAVRADIDRRAGEARNPPVAMSPLPSADAGRSGLPGLSTRPVRRRTLLFTGGGLVTVAAGAAAMVLRPDRSRVDGSGAGAPTASSPVTAPVTSPVSSPVTAGATPSSPGSRTVEIYAYGRTTVKTLTSVVNGQTETVHGVPLPYRRIVQVPPEPAPVTWRFVYHCTAGVFNWVVTVDGYRVGGGGSTSNNPDIRGDRSSGS